MSRRGSPRGKVTMNASPERYVITVDADELPLIAALLGRDLAPKRAPKPRAKAQATRRAPMPKPPKLSDKARTWLEGEWDRAIAEPEAWHVGLAKSKARPMGYASADDVAKAWGLPPVQARLIDARAARQKGATDVSR